MRVSAAPKAWTWRPTALHRNNAVLAALRRDAAWARAAPQIREVVEEALFQCLPWTQVPFLNTLSYNGDLGLNRVHQIEVWTISNVARLDGYLVIPAEVNLWTPSGSMVFSPGQHKINDVRRVIGETRGFLTLDRRACSVIAHDPKSEEGSKECREHDSQALIAEDSGIYRRLDEFKEAMPDCASWIREAVCIVVPEPKSSSGLHSSSDPRLPGTVWLQARNRDFLLEGLVHETAHLYFDRADSEASLTLDTAAIFRSPLRKEPRTLRSVLVAYHALAYIAAFYRDAMEARLVSMPRAELELADTIELLQQGAASIESGHDALTPAGRTFLRRTQQVWLD